MMRDKIVAGLAFILFGIGVILLFVGLYGLFSSPEVEKLEDTPVLAIEGDTTLHLIAEGDLVEVYLRFKGEEETKNGEKHQTPEEN